jgi:hypothetical protein
MILYFISDSNSVWQGQQFVYLQYSKCYSHSGGLYVYENNFRRMVSLFNARILPRHTWINDQDRYLVPKDKTK